MFAKHKSIKMTRHWLLAIVLLPALFGCTAFDQEVGMADDEVPITFLVDEDDDSPFTRGAYQTATQFTKYEVYSFCNGFNDNKLWVANVLMTKNGSGWKSSRTVSFRGKNALDFYALKPAFVDSDQPNRVQNLVMTPTEKSFVHTLPNTNAKQEDFMFSSLHTKTKQNTNGGSLLFKFKHMFTYLRFKGKVAVDNLHVKVRSITFHNIKSTGKFTFSETKDRGGSWEISDAVDNYTFLFPEERELTTTKDLLHREDSMLFVMPHAADVFTLEDAGFAPADVAGQEKAYAEIECRLWKMEDDGNGGQVAQYIGCSETSWAQVYYPMDASACNWGSSSSYGNYKYFSFDFTGGYTYEGEDFLNKYTNGAMQIVSLEPIGADVETDPWTDQPDDDVDHPLEFNM